MNVLRLAAPLAVLVLGSTAAGCYAGSSSADSGGSGTDGDEGTGPGDSDGGSDGGDDDDGDDGGEPGARCESSRVGPPLLRRLTQHEFDATVRALFPEIDGVFGGVALGADTVSSLGFGNDAGVLVVSEQAAREILDTAEDVAALVTAEGTLSTVLPCAGEGADVGCAITFAEERGERMFRRPLRPEEVDAYAELFSSVASRSDFATGIEWMLVAMLQSPHLVYRSELGVADSGSRTLTGWELATALAYDYTGRPPSDDLRALGAQGALDDPQARVEQARALIATEAGRETLGRFFEDWLDYRRVGTKVRNDVPEFEGVRDAMIEETRQFIETVVLDERGGVDALLLADYTAVDAALSQFYGFGEVQGDFDIVPRPESWGVGLLAQGSILAANAHVDASSPTQRGLLVYERLLCNERPPVPADIPPIEPPSPGVSTTRERYEDQHMANDGCRSCHALFDPIGFAFEHFDAAGRFRPDEGGLQIDASGEIPAGVVGEDVTFDGLTELSRTLAERPVVTDCVSGLTASYVFGGAGGVSCLAEDARTALAEGEFGLAEYVAQLAGAPHFGQRTAD